MIEIEFEPPKESVCDCCGNTTIKLVRFVYKDDSAFAVYYAQFTKDHPEKRLSGLIGIGEWGDGASPDKRMAFPFQIWSQDDGFMVGMVDREDSSYSDVTLLGKMLDRRESLSHELIDEVFHITDHMVRDDPEIVAFFGNERPLIAGPSRPGILMYDDLCRTYQTVAIVSACSDLESKGRLLGTSHN